MIRVIRRAPPKALVGDTSSAAKERDAWKTYYQTGLHRNPDADKPKFSAYRLEPVKTALVKMFRGKCAYCESQIQVVTWGDVEHYRPKSAIYFDDGSKKKPGYWWLASDWDNLLLACNRCNSLNRQEFEGQKGQTTFGKGNKFPLAVESRTQWPDDDPLGWQSSEQGEAPLLIDPCRDPPPERSLRCQVSGGDEVGILTGLDRRGTESIKVFGLNRKPLVQRRREKLKAIDVLINDFGVMKDLLASTERDLDRARRAQDAIWQAEKEADLQKIMGSLVEKRRSLEAMTAADNEYLLTTRPVVEEFLKKHPVPN